MAEITFPARQVWPDLSLVFAPERVLFQRDGGVIMGKEFLTAAHRLAAQLPDQPVINLCRDLRLFTVLFAATLLRGQHVILTGNRTSDGLAKLAVSHGAVCVAITGDPDNADLPAGGIELPDPFGGLGEWMAAGDRPFNPVIPADTLVAIVFTSGSTGESVEHRKSWGGLVTPSVARRALLDPDPDPACLVSTVPPYHLYGFEAQCLATRVSAVTGPDRYPADWQHQLKQARAPGILVTTPLQLSSLVRSDLTLPPIRRVVSAAAPLGTEQAAAAETLLATEVMEIYGATETGSVATRRTLNGPRWELCDGTLRALQPDVHVQMRKGVWFAPDRPGGDPRALLLIRTQATGMDLPRQKDAQGTIRQAFASLHPGVAHLLISGPSVFALSSATAMRHDVDTMAIFSTLIVAMILYWRFRSLWVLAAIGVPFLLSLGVAMIVVRLVFGAVHGIAFSFGMTMLGVSLDYPVLLIGHRDRGEGPDASLMMAVSGHDAQEVLRREEALVPVMRRLQAQGAITRLPRLSLKHTISRPSLHRKIMCFFVN